jgi:hypothetical protein
MGYLPIIANGHSAPLQKGDDTMNIQPAYNQSTGKVEMVDTTIPACDISTFTTRDWTHVKAHTAAGRAFMQKHWKHFVIVRAGSPYGNPSVETHRAARLVECIKTSGLTHARQTYFNG